MKKVLTFLLFAGLIAGLYFVSQQGLSNSQVPAIVLNRQDGYQLLVNGKRFLIQGVCYNPIPIGKDYEYNFWGDPSKPWLTDGKMMKAIGVNTVRFYRPGKNPLEVRQVLNDLHQRFGIRVLMGHYLGFWSWPPPNYASGEFRERIRTEVLEMVHLYKNSPAILMWVLGNENNYSFDQNVQRWSTDAIDAMPDVELQKEARAKIYYSFINSLARDIKKIDSRHPVAMGVGEAASLQWAKEMCPDVDVIGMIAYRGQSFGNLFRQVKQKFDLPVVMIEWGADSFNAMTREPDERDQAEFLKLQWQDILRNTDPKKGAGNCLGGTLFEWNDEWWKANENLPYTWSVHEEAARWYNNSYYYDADVKDRLNMNEEWWGVVSLNPKKTMAGVDERVPKKAYEVMKSLWAKR